MKRGEVWWVNLDPTVGAEIKKKRPCVLVGATPVNKARRTVVVIPLSTSGKPRPPLAIPVTCLGKSVVAVSDQIRAVDKTRLIEMTGMLTEADMLALAEGLKRVLVL
jgi:mRNA interferase MazF